MPIATMLAFLVACVPFVVVTAVIVALSRRRWLKAIDRKRRAPRFDNGLGYLSDPGAGGRHHGQHHHHGHHTSHSSGGHHGGGHDFGGGGHGH
ncbi:hypothetical protein [Streptacidiphilus sp. MAP5-3]|jgi:hypothetical protein|uniref:hypothetical protein n=1 Tax=unclassified Streptacidiphilus TaxID=2643834 RepID=UPI0035168DF4